MRTENLLRFITEIERGKCLIELDRITNPFIQKNFTILNNKEHYVRTTIKSRSSFVSNVSVYENPTKG